MNNTGYAIVPKDLCECDLKPADALIYVTMLDDAPFYQKERGFYAPSNAALARYGFISERRCQDALERLEKGGFITRDGKTTNNNTIWIVNDYTKLKSKPSIKENRKRVTDETSGTGRTKCPVVTDETSGSNGQNVLHTILSSSSLHPLFILFLYPL